MSKPTLPPPIVTFRDALGFAMELTSSHVEVHAALLLTRDGQPIDLGLVEGPCGTIETVTDWAVGLRSWARSPRRLLLASVRPFDSDVVREHDLRLFRRASWSLAAAGADLLDWIETDGDLFRSYAYLTCPAHAWPTDPIEHRLVDGGLS